MEEFLGIIYGGERFVYKEKGEDISRLAARRP